MNVAQGNALTSFVRNNHHSTHHHTDDGLAGGRATQGDTPTIPVTPLSIPIYYIHPHDMYLLAR